jgi:DNA repair protein RecO (recombination protein O)
MGRLTHIEAEATARELKGDGLLAGFYLNELLLRLVPRGDQNEAILSCYSSCLDRLTESRDTARALRLFELELLEALGYRVDLEHDIHSGEPIAPEREYVFEHEGGLTASDANSTMELYSGKHLISLREHQLTDAESLRSARQLLRRILNSHLGDRPLKTRQVLREIVQRGFSR